MFKILLILCVFISFNLTAKTLKIDSSSNIDFILEENNETKVYIECSELPYFKFLDFPKDDITRKICNLEKQDKNFELNFDDLIKFLKNNEKYKNDLVNYGISIRYLNYYKLNDLNNKNNVLNVFINLNSEAKKIYFTISSLKDTKLIVDFKYYPSNSQSILIKKENLIKNYKYNLNNKKIELFELEKEISEYNYLNLTNDYDINKETECINGLLWVKKYGQNSGNCDYIEKK